MKIKNNWFYFMHYIEAYYMVPVSIINNKSVYNHISIAKKGLRLAFGCEEINDNQK